jgi:Mycothiol maleylpyruvate isomerase N-terminal domain
MPERTFVEWVEPIAATLAEDRRQVIAFARSASAEIWAQSSDVDGWSYKDILAHLAGGNDLMLQRLLRSVVAHEPLDPSLPHLDTDVENARGVEARRDWPLEALIAELERDGDEVQDLLARLTTDDEHLHPDAFSISVGRFLQIVEEERHDLLHLEQLRGGLR